MADKSDPISFDPLATDTLVDDLEPTNKAPSSGSSDINIDDFEAVDMDQVPKSTPLNPDKVDTFKLEDSDYFDYLTSSQKSKIDSSVDKVDPIEGLGLPGGNTGGFDPLLDLGVPSTGGSLQQDLLSSGDTSPNIPSSTVPGDDFLMGGGPTPAPASTPSLMDDPHIDSTIIEPTLLSKDSAPLQELISEPSPASQSPLIQDIIEPTPPQVSEFMKEPTPPPMREPSPQLIREPTPPLMEKEPTPPPMKEPTPPLFREPSPPPMKEPTPPPMKEPSPPPPMKEPTPPPFREPTPPPPKEPTPPPPKEPTPPPKEPTPPPPKEPTPPPIREPTPPPPKEPTPPPMKEPTPPPVKEPSPPPPAKEPSPVVKSSPPSKIKEVVSPKAYKGAIQESKVTCSKEVQKSLAIFKPWAWFHPDQLDPRVVELIYWHDVKKTGVVFGSIVLLLLSLAYLSLISVIAYTSLSLLTGTICFRIYKNIMQAIQKSADGHPFREYLELDTNLPADKVHEVTDVVVGQVNSLVSELKRLFLVEDLVDSVKFGSLLWCLTYVGQWFNGLTLVILSVIALFSLPKVYEQNQGQIDQYVGLARSQVNDIMTKIKAAIPIGNKEKTQ